MKGSGVSVISSLDCWTDLKMLHAQMKVGVVRKKVKPICWDDLQLVGLRMKWFVIGLANVCEMVEVSWNEVTNGVEMWEVLIGI